MLLSVLEVVAPFKHFAKLRDFVEMKLPQGFPVKIGKFYISHFFSIYENYFYYFQELQFGVENSHMFEL